MDLEQLQSSALKEYTSLTAALSSFPRLTGLFMYGQFDLRASADAHASGDALSHSCGLAQCYLVFYSVPFGEI
jgi:hypothetical protein